MECGEKLIWLESAWWASDVDYLQRTPQVDDLQLMWMIFEECLMGMTFASGRWPSIPADDLQEVLQVGDLHLRWMTFAPGG